MDMTRKDFFLLSTGAAIGGAALANAQQQNAQRPNPDLGFKDTPMEPGMPWHVHDPDRPHPKVITPAATPGGAPSGATGLFCGRKPLQAVLRGAGAESAGEG